MPGIYVSHMRFQITGLPAWVFAFLASKRFLTSVWYFSPLGRLQEKLHSLQAKGFSPACCSMCFKWMSMTFLASILKTETLVMENYCPIIRLFSRVDSHVDSKPASLIARVVALWTNKRFLSAVNSHVGFQIGKFGTRVATLIAFVIFLYIRLDLVDFGHLEKFWKSWKVNVMTVMMRTTTTMLRTKMNMKVMRIDWSTCWR